MGQLLDLIEKGLVSGLRGKDILTLMLDNPKSECPEEIAKNQGWIQDQNRSAIEALCKKVISDNPDVVRVCALLRFNTQVRKMEAGKPRLIKFFVGEVMKASSGRSDPKLALEIIQSLLKKP